MKCKILVLLIFFSSCVSLGYKEKSIKQKSSILAFGYSLGATVLPSVPTLIFLYASDEEVYVPSISLALGLSGIVFGPSMGHFYAGNRERGRASIGFRAICFGVGYLSGFGAGYSFYAGNENTAGVLFMIAIASGVGMAGSALSDIATCPNSVEKYNKSIRNHGGLYLGPEIDVKDGSYGMRLVYRF